MTLSIITPVLDSHEIVRRQMLHYAKMPLPKGVEVILVDDGSDPPLARTCHFRSIHGADPRQVSSYSANGCPAHLVVTGDTRPWTEMVAFNRGVDHSEGEYILKADIDYIVTKEAIRQALAFTGDRMDFTRKFGVLDENGDIQDDPQTLREWGLKRKYIGKVHKGHRNQWLMRKSIFNQLGGYNEEVAGKWLAASADAMFFHAWTKLAATGTVKIADEKPLLYSFPNGKHCGSRDYNPHGFFHNLKRQ